MSSSMWYMVRSTKDLFENERGYEKCRNGGIRDTRSNCCINGSMEEIDSCMRVHLSSGGNRWQLGRWHIHKRWCRVFKVVQL